MSCGNTSAVLDVVTESKHVSAILRENGKQYDNSRLYSNDNLLVQSPSIESFSTMQDIENLSELTVDNHDSDLCVYIDKPQKHLDTLETYVTFRLTTKVARIEFEENEYIVRRRYNDFLWLRMKLSESHPFCIIPPLPAKHSLFAQLDRYSKDFIYNRMKALNTFVYRLVQHPILSCNENFKIFLTAKNTDFILYRKQKPVIVENSARSSNTLVPHTNLKSKHLEFDKLKIYLTALSEKIVSIDKIATRISKERLELVNTLQGLYPVFINWSEHEPDLAPLLRSISIALEKTTQAHNGLSTAHEATVMLSIRDFLQYVDVVQNTVQKRNSYQATYEHAMTELNKRKNEKEMLVAVSQSNNSNSSGGFSFWKATGSTTNSYDDRIEKLGSCIPQLLNQAESHQDRLECANEQLRSDVDRWQEEKRQMLKTIMLAFVDSQIEFYEKSVNAWENVTSRITNGEV